MSIQHKNYCLPLINYKANILKNPKSHDSSDEISSDRILSTSSEKTNDEYTKKNVNSSKAISKSKKTRIPFSKEEDEKIVKLTKIYGTKQWRLISNFIEGRTPKQCRDRYTNYLIPGYFNGEWSKKEDELLIKLHEKYGSKWSIMHKFFNGRSVNAIKNRWNYFLCRQKNDKNADMTYTTFKDLHQDDDFFDLNLKDFILSESEIYQNEDSSLIPFFL